MKVEFINQHLYRFCKNSRPPIEFTRSRPYEKNDNAHIEQKNWTHVRKFLGWDRYDTLEVLEAMNDLYENELRGWDNLFQPSVKCIKKIRKGSRLIRQFDSPKTPLQRLLESKEANPKKVQELQKLFDSLDPFKLSEIIDQKLQRIASMATQKVSSQKAFNPSMLSKDFKRPLRYSLKSPWRNWTFSPKINSIKTTMKTKTNDDQHGLTGGDLPRRDLRTYLRR